MAGSLENWWATSPYEGRPAIPQRDTEDHVPVDLQFQRAAHDPNLGKQTSELMRLSPIFYQRFGAGDISLSGHVAQRLEGIWEYLEPGDYKPLRRLADAWTAMQAIDWHTDLVI